MKTITGIDPDNQTKDQVGHRQIISIKVAVIETGTDIENRQGNRAIAIMKSRTKDQTKTTVETMTIITSKDGLYLMLNKFTYVKEVLKAIVTKGDLSPQLSSLETSHLTEGKAGDLMIIIWLTNLGKFPHLILQESHLITIDSTSIILIREMVVIKGTQAQDQHQERTLQNRSNIESLIDRDHVHLRVLSNAQKIWNKLSITIRRVNLCKIFLQKETIQRTTTTNVHTHRTHQEELRNLILSVVKDICTPVLVIVSLRLFFEHHHPLLLKNTHRLTLGQKLKM
jgi:hypothetical protein